MPKAPSSSHLSVIAVCLLALLMFAPQAKSQEAEKKELDDRAQINMAMTTFVDALFARNLKSAMSCCYYQPEQAPMLMVGLSKISADLRLGESVRRKLGVAVARESRISATSRDEILQELFAMQITIKGDQAHIARGNNLRFQRVNGAWKLIAEDEFLANSLNELIGAMAKEMTRRDVEADILVSADDVKRSVEGYKKTFAESLGDLTPPPAPGPPAAADKPAAETSPAESGEKE